MDIAIIGGGLSGTLLAHYLLQEDAYPLTIYLFEKDYHQLSRGIAYRASTEGQLLNVPANRMSLHSHKPDEFYQWLLSNVSKEILPDEFVQRSYFGTYLKEVFQKSIEQAKHITVRVITDEVIDIIKDDDTLHVITAKNHTYVVSRAIVANGIIAPQDPFSVGLDIKLSNLYQSNPWSFRYQDQLKINDHVILIGTGLTTLDHAVSLLRSGKNLTLIAFSRRGLLPLPHAQYKPYTFPDYNIESTSDIGALLRSIRTYYKEHREKGLDWRDLIDKIRTQAPHLWKGLNAKSKTRFIRHLKPYWEIHRHRAPTIILDRISEAAEKGRFKLLKGRIQEVKTTGNALQLTLANPEETQVLEANYLLNSSGLQQNISLTSDPLLKKLMEREYMIADGNGLGIETDDSGALQCKEGMKNIFTIGALRRAAVFECTAAKEIGEQAYELSRTLLNQKIN